MAEWKTATLTLDYPLDADGPQQGLKVTEIKFREPDVEAIEAIQALDLPTGQKVVLGVTQVRQVAEALLADKSQAPYLKRMHRRDFEKLGDIIVPLALAPETPISGQSTT